MTKRSWLAVHLGTLFFVVVNIFFGSWVLAIIGTIVFVYLPSKNVIK